MFILKFNKYNFLGWLILIALFIILMLSLNIKFKDMKDFKISADLLFSDIKASFLRVTLISIIAWISGIICGYFLYHFQILHSLFIAFINFVRHISPFCWLPFAIIWFGLGEAPVAFIMFITLFFPTLIASISTFSNIPSEYLDEAQVSGANQFQIFFRIELPLIIGSLFNLFRIIWGLGWATIIAVEMLGVNSGLGFRLLDFRYLLKYPDMLFYVIIMGTIGIFIDYLLRIFIEKIKY